MPAPRCGDGITQANEQCDDANTVNNDACTNGCKRPACGDGILQAGEQCDGGTRQQGCGNCNRGTRTDTCSGCQWAAGTCSDPDASVGAVTTAYQQAVAEESEANWGFGGPCGASNVRDSYQVIKQSGAGSCDLLYSDWAKLSDAATPVRDGTPMPISDNRFCGVVLGVLGPVSCQVVIKQKRVCP